MMLEDTFAERRGMRAETGALQLLILVFLAMRLYFDLRVDLTSDEAYYWMWGQRPGWSYFDHPPLDAWLLAIAAAIGGWHPIVARALTWVTFAGVLLIFRDWSRRLAPEDPWLWFWRTAAIYVSSPVFFIFTTPAFHDHLLVFLCLLATHLFALFVQKAERGEPGATPWLYVAAAALGLAVLTKYNGVFVGFGFAATFLLRPRLRAFLITPHPWLAALLAIAMQAPVFYWNLTAGFASYRFHLDDRWGAAAGTGDLQRSVNFVALSITMLSPFLAWPTVRLLRDRPLPGFEASAKTIAVATFTVSTLVLLLVSVFLNAFFYWNIVAFAALLPLLTRHTNVWLRIGHYLYGLIVCGAVLWNFAGLPISSYDRISAVSYGWQTIADRVQSAATANPADMIGATRMSTTSQLGFALRTIDVVNFSDDRSQYDYWQQPETWAGKSALVLIDQAAEARETSWLRDHFTKLTLVDQFQIEQLGRPIYKWRILRGERFKP